MKYFICLLFSTILFGQQSVVITYESKATVSDEAAAQMPVESREQLIKFLTEPKYSELTNNGNESLVKNIPNKEIHIPSNLPKSNTVEDRGMIIKPFIQWIYKDFSTKLTYFKTAIDETPYYRSLQIKTKNTLTFDKKTLLIDRYKCLSAFEIGENNDTIQYWYTQEIPIFDSPKRMIEIPGLVLRIVSKNKTETAIKIEFFDKKLNIEGLNKKIAIKTNEEFKELEKLARQSKIDSNEKGNEVKTIKL